jgi:integrase
MATYNSQLRVHILPILGGYSLPALRNSHIRSWIVELVEGDIGQTTIKQSFRLLKQILEAAVTDGRMLANPCNGIKLPKKAKKNAQAFTPKEVDDLADACGQYGDLVKFLASTGLRVSEALALQVRDLDFSNMKINVVRTWTTNESGVKVLGSTKTRENRTIPISPIVDSILRIRSSGKDLEQFVFTGHGGGTLDYGYFRRAYFSPAVQKLGLDGATIHWLRHTCASLMIKIGAPPTTISHILGHSGVKMTLDTYAHYYEDDTASWLEKLSTTYREGK